MANIPQEWIGRHIYSFAFVKRFGPAAWTFQEVVTADRWDVVLCLSLVSIYVNVTVATVQILCVDGDREFRRIWCYVVEFYFKWIGWNI